MEKSGLLDPSHYELKAEDESIVTEIIALIHKIYKMDKYVQKEGARISQLEKSIKDLEESLRLQKALLAKLTGNPNYENIAKESRYTKDERDKRNTTCVLCTLADDVSASCLAASEVVSQLEKQSRVSDSAGGASESAYKKSDGRQLLATIP